MPILAAISPFLVKIRGSAEGETEPGKSLSGQMLFEKRSFLLLFPRQDVVLRDGKENV